MIDCKSFCYNLMPGLSQMCHNTTTCIIVDWTGVILMADKFGAAMTLVKSDIGGNISVCFVTCFYLVFFIPYIYAALDQCSIFVFLKMTYHGYMAILYLEVYAGCRFIFQIHI